MNFILLNEGPLGFIAPAGIAIGAVLALAGIVRFGYPPILLGIVVAAASLCGGFAIGNQDSNTLTDAVQQHYGISLTSQETNDLLTVHQGAYQAAPRVETQAGTAYIYGTATVHAPGKAERATLYKLNGKFVLGLANPTNSLRELPAK